MKMTTVAPVKCPRELKKAERAMLTKLSRRKFYDRNHPEEQRPYLILRRVFVPANHDGIPTVILLCQVTTPTKDGTFEYAVFGDDLHGRGHWPSDKYGAGTMKDALAAFEENVVCALFGYWPWVIRKHLRDVKKALAA